MSHSGVALACLRTPLVTKGCEALQDIRCGSYLCGRLAAVPLLTWDGNTNASQRTNTSYLYLAPAKMQGKPTNTVERMLLVSGQYGRYVNRILALPLGWRAVVVCPAQLQDTRELFPPSRLDLAQDG
jgi:hypothetical protein